MYLGLVDEGLWLVGWWDDGGDGLVLEGDDIVE